LRGRKTLKIILELGIGVVALNLLSVIPPSKFEGEYIQKLILRMTQKRGLLRKKPVENVIHKGMIWMPYFRVQYTYTRHGKGLIRTYGKAGRGETALNAMLCGSVKGDRDFFMLFRPNYLKRKIVRYLPQSGEIVGPTVRTDFDEVLKRLLERLNKVKDELYELRSALSKSRVRMRRYSIFAPLMGHLKQNEEKLSEKAARLHATKIFLSFCLNVNDNLDSIKVAGHSIFYYPTFVVTFKHKENGSERYLIINLVKSGLISKHLSCDKGLTELCNRNNMCKEVIARALTSTRANNLYPQIGGKKH